MSDSDLALARLLQDQFDQEANQEIASFLPVEYRSPQKKVNGSGNKLNVVADEWETIDPTPDLHALFIEFNQTFFWGKLLSCEVRWSPRMTQCAGICRYSPRERFCTIGISIPLLKLRPRKDLVETLLHEMIHAFLFITNNNDNHESHGPEFHKHMYRINKATGANISVYHTFHDEVALYKQHWWRCSGPCTKRPPFFGIVKRSMNRKPGPYDRWWAEHQNSCGGVFNKIKEPEGYGKKKGKENKKDDPKPNGMKDIRSFIQNGKGVSQNNNKRKGGTDINQGTSPNKRKVGNPGTSPNKRKIGKPGTSPNKNKIGNPGSVPISSKGVSGTAPGGKIKGGGGRGNIFGFGGTSFHGPGSGKGSPGKDRDNSSSGSVIKPGSSTNTGSVMQPGPSSMSTSSVTGGGKTLGGTSVSDAGMSARDRARLKWASSFNSQSQVTSNKTKPPQLKSSQTDTKNNSSSSIKNGIKDSNKSSTSPVFSSKNGKSDTSILSKFPVNNESRNIETKEETSKCPVCDKSVAMNKINDHLDLCLTETSLESPKKSDSVHKDHDAKKSFSPNQSTSAKPVEILDDEDKFSDDDDDAVLSQALEDAEASFSSSRDDLEEAKASIDSPSDPKSQSKSIVKNNDQRKKWDFITKDIVEIDSDDDSDDDDLPLVRGHQDSQHINRINDSMNQDDLDMLASLADRHEYSSEEFACPVCNTLVASDQINSHLDNCIQSC